MPDLNDKKIILAAGGTGGHINPALAVAGELREEYPGMQILFIGTAEKMESRLVPEAGYDFKTISITGFRRSFKPDAIIRNIKTVFKLAVSAGQAKKIIEDFAPDAVVGFGGYVSGPVVRTAARMGIPTAIHEQNAYPGITNKALAKIVDAVMLTAPQAEKYLECKNPCTVTGLPVRGDMLKADKAISRSELGIDERPMVLSMGGSLGAAPINNAMKEVIAKKHASAEWYFMHATGSSGKGMADELRGMGVDPSRERHVIIREYIDDMSRCMAAADVVICRAGASTLSELQAMGKPSILIPSPYVAENHQYHNAMALVENDAALIIEEKDLTSELLIKKLDELLSNKAKLAKIGENAKKMAVTDAQKHICSVIERIMLK